MTIGRVGRVTLGGALAARRRRLAEVGVESARLDAELLLAHACDDCARALLYAELDRELTDDQERAPSTSSSPARDARAARVRARRVGLPAADADEPTGVR